MFRGNGSPDKRGSRLAALLAAAAVLTLTLAGCGGSAAGGSVSWRLAETHPRDYPTTQADIWFADQLRERTNGRIDIEVFPDAQLGEERDVMEQVKLGSVEMTRTNANLVTEFVSSWEAFGIPYVFDDEQHFWNFLNGPGGKRKLEELNQAGYVGLTYYDSGARNFYTGSGPVEEPSDLHGQNIRVQPGSLTSEMVEAMGGSATTMNFSEVYSGLETGVIDGAENNLPSYVSTGHYEVADDITMDKHQRVPEVLMVGQQVWNQLGQQDKELVREVAEESTEVQRDLWKKEVEKARQTLEQEGVDIHDVDTAKFRAAVSGMIDKYEGRFGDFTSAVDEARNTD
ncbi:MULTISPECIES: TRAP transporter substrate-binding protein [Actinopolyspora]|uniref:Tripartite ATP-independent transporter solute receptor, DctP family n=1 Tax=Actinopolyspora saharensis TaxID=995062 RepID=A0A1H0Z8P6_9ACTN|nr:TRAP transporter substrate-binding protein [Actinopolyspora saharensis]NHD15925.1 TRAP transporter substrate-binding protein [Actinopolyspora sp. BKK2]NHE74861.1 TRAP transporter substrate-binding protein [Actinopolyspora sp. BKK1]SDQ23778.1 tripartite ATP-independent transporter solute receptor, DctP family [Actinopolyspora saharensis]